MSAEHFVKLKNEDAESRIQLLSRSSTVVKLWQQRWPGMYLKSLPRDDGKLVLRADRNVEYNNASALYFYFTLSNVKYFARISLQKLEHNDYIVHLASELFRCEKRSYERVLIYPAHKAYLNVPLQAEMPDNVAMFDMKSEVNKNFESYLDSVVADDPELGKLTSLQIIDISASGLSCIACVSEAQALAAKQQLPAILDFKNRQYRFKNCRVVYCVDYIDPRFYRVRMKKVGIDFGEINSELSVELNAYFGVAVDENLLESSFEKLLS